MRSGVRAALTAALCLMVASCTSSSVDDVTTPSASYPSVYTPVNAATAQMSNDEAQALEGRLTRLGSRRATGAISQAEYLRRRAELEALAANHGADTQKEITQ